MKVRVLAESQGGVGGTDQAGSGRSGVLADCQGGAGGTDQAGSGRSGVLADCQGGARGTDLVGVNGSDGLGGGRAGQGCSVAISGRADCSGTAAGCWGLLWAVVTRPYVRSPSTQSCQDIKDKDSFLGHVRTQRGGVRLQNLWGGLQANSGLWNSLRALRDGTPFPLSPSFRMVYQVLVNFNYSKNKVLEVADSLEEFNKTTIRELKEKLKQKIPGAPDLDLLRVIFGRDPLEDHQTLEFYIIKHLSLLLFLMKMPGGGGGGTDMIYAFTC
ncbi:hypothetical protein DPX16_4194 [Anabarilius grahami]|uniref:Ubiquitin-like domain-containing protein n=1 Tax=Anabarilius grahami TaxID=495550 RepID=A0A3N0YRR0_ANAGA|nr:hypothetical protein DPX16_4194 [Anabarilius grahami]